jgi:hypothetical protein
VVEEIIGRLPQLTSSQLGRLEDALRRERQRRASSEGGGEGAPQTHEGTAPPVTEVLEYRAHEDGYLQLELRRYIRRDGSARERGPYWYFQFHEGGKRKKAISERHYVLANALLKTHNLSSVVSRPIASKEALDSTELRLLLCFAKVHLRQ